MWHRRPRRWTAAEGGCATREVVIQYGTQRSEIWEWYNDLDKNQRLSKIRALMKSIASQ